MWQDYPPPLVLLTRDPVIIRAVQSATGDKPGQFDRDASPTAGIARATGEDSLLYSNGPVWRRQKRMSAQPFSRSNLFQPEKFHGFEQTFRKTVAKRLELLRSRQEASGKKQTRVELESEINVVMLEMLVSNFFGGSVSYEELRDRFVPALVFLIDHMVSDTVAPRAQALSIMFSGGNKILKQKKADFEALTDIALSGRAEGWGYGNSSSPTPQMKRFVVIFECFLPGLWNLRPRSRAGQYHIYRAHPTFRTRSIRK